MDFLKQYLRPKKYYGFTEFDRSPPLLKYFVYFLQLYRMEFDTYQYYMKFSVDRYS